jgi:hypothetical protein
LPVLQRNPHPEVGSFVMKLCVGAAVLMLMRTPLLPLALLGDYLHTYFPDIPTSDTYGKVNACLDHVNHGKICTQHAHE